MVFNTWRQDSWDVNDRVLASDPRTAPDVGDRFRRLIGDAPGAFTSWYDRRIGGSFGMTPKARAAERKAAAHATTPTSTHFDALGRTCMTAVDDGAAGRHATRVALPTTFTSVHRGPPSMPLR